MIEAVALPPLPEINPGDDLAGLIAQAAGSEFAITADDVLVVAQKVVSKAEGQIVALEKVIPSEQAESLTSGTDRDPRLVEVILSESKSLIKATDQVLVCETQHGFVCANAGVDCSNTGGSGRAILLPADPDRSARMLRESLKQLLGVEPAVVITDSFGRAWRNGQVEVAIGCAGLAAINDLAGRHDSDGRELKATATAIADQVASAADLARTKTSRQPAVLVRGLAKYVSEDDGPGAGELLRPESEDLFR